MGSKAQEEQRESGVLRFGDFAFALRASCKLVRAELAVLHLIGGEAPALHLRAKSRPKVHIPGCTWAGGWVGMCRVGPCVFTLNPEGPFVVRIWN